MPLWLDGVLLVKKGQDCDLIKDGAGRCKNRTRKRGNHLSPGILPQSCVYPNQLGSVSTSYSALQSEQETPGIGRSVVTRGTVTNCLPGESRT